MRAYRRQCGVEGIERIVPIGLGANHTYRHRRIRNIIDKAANHRRYGSAIRRRFLVSRLASQRPFVAVANRTYGLAHDNDNRDVTRQEVQVGGEET